jgi:hypothetical protein
MDDTFLRFAALDGRSRWSPPEPLASRAALLKPLRPSLGGHRQSHVDPGSALTVACSAVRRSRARKRRRRRQPDSSQMDL